MALVEYQSVYERILVKELHEPVDGMEGGVWVDRKSLLDMQEFADYLVREVPQVRRNNLFSSLENVVNTGLSVTLKELINNIVGGLPKIAHQQHKDTPNVIAQCPEVRVKNECRLWLEPVLFVLLKNIVEKNIELPTERVQKGKTAKGNISINCSLKESYVELEVKDDGRRIDLEKLYEDGSRLGLWSNSAKLDSEYMINAYFLARQEQDISEDGGAFAGMSLVELCNTVNQYGGSVSLHIDNQYEASDMPGVLASLSTIVAVPKKYFSAMYDVQLAAKFK